MKSLFVTMLLWFSGGTAVVVLGAVTGYTLTNPDRVLFGWTHVGKGAIVTAGRAAVAAYERGGEPELRQNLDVLRQDTGLRGELLDAGARELGGYLVAPNVRANLLSLPDGGLILNVREYAAGVGLRSHKGAQYFFVTTVPRRDDGRLWSWIFITALILTGGLLCFALARYVTAPVVQLRMAASRFSAGDLTVRVSTPDVLKRNDEIGGLARDFNQMADRIESLMKAQQNLIANVSHELRSPITRLGLALGLIRRRLESASRGDELLRIEREVERLKGLVSQLLTLSRLECLDQPLANEPIDLSALIQDIASDANFEATSMDRGVRLAVCEGCSVRGSRDLIRSAIENVVRNALRYTEPNTDVSICLTCHDGAGSASVIIEDHGPGVRPDALNSIFEPFYRIEEAREHHSGGVGLGLAITRQIVKLHGGEVRAANRDSGGLEMRITLPTISGY